MPEGSWVLRRMLGRERTGRLFLASGGCWIRPGRCSREGEAPDPKPAPGRFGAVVFQGGCGDMVDGVARVRRRAPDFGGHLAHRSLRSGLSATRPGQRPGRAQSGGDADEPAVQRRGRPRRPPSLLASRATGRTADPPLTVGTVPGVVIGAMIRVFAVPRPRIFRLLIASLLLPLGLWLCLRTVRPAPTRTPRRPSPRAADFGRSGCGIAARRRQAEQRRWHRRGRRGRRR